VGEFVDDGDADLSGQLVEVVTGVAERQPEDRYHVGPFGSGALGVGNPLVETEEVGLVGVAVDHADDDVVEYRRQLGGKRGERLIDETLEPVAGERVQPVR